jgi:drug/metabolite transporter (DMT)-like permease
MQSLWMLCAAFAFALMTACVKLASDYYSTAEIVLARGIIGALIILITMRLQGGCTLKTPFPKQHVMRGIVGVTSQWLWFYSYTLLPVAMATTINSTSSIWIVVILFAIAWHRREKEFEWGLAGAIVLSFVGVALLLRPSVDDTQFLGTIIGLISSFTTALVFMQVRKLGQMGEPEYRIVFYFSIVCTLMGLGGCIYLGVIPFLHNLDPYALLLILGMGVTSTIGQMAMTRAYRLGNPLIVSNLQYSGIIFTSILGILIWQDTLDWIGWASIGLILTSGLASTFYNHRANRALQARRDEEAKAVAASAG